MFCSNFLWNLWKSWALIVLSFNGGAHFWGCHYCTFFNFFVPRNTNKFTGKWFFIKKKNYNFVHQWNKDEFFKARTLVWSPPSKKISFQKNFSIKAVLKKNTMHFGTTLTKKIKTSKNIYFLSFLIFLFEKLVFYTALYNM